MTKILGKPLADEWLQEIHEKIISRNLSPKLGILLVGDHRESKTYVDRKKQTGELIGVEVNVMHLSEHSNREAVKTGIDRLLATNDGVIIQMPVPEHLNPDEILNMIPLEKDVDGLSVKSMTCLERGRPLFLPATVRGIVYLLENQGVVLKKNSFAVVGPGRLVGKPLALYLKNKGAKVIVIEKNEKSPEKKTKSADVIVSATGTPHLITREYVSPGQFVIDAGFSYANGKPIGDVMTQDVENIVNRITPVPGGVGPLTVAALFANIVDTFKS